MLIYHWRLSVYVCLQLSCVLPSLRGGILPLLCLHWFLPFYSSIQARMVSSTWWNSSTWWKNWALPRWANTNCAVRLFHLVFNLCREHFLVCWSAPHTYPYRHMLRSRIWSKVRHSPFAMVLLIRHLISSMLTYPTSSTFFSPPPLSLSFHYFISFSLYPSLLFSLFLSFSIYLSLSLSLSLSSSS